MAHYFRIDHHARLLAVFSPKCGSTTLREWSRALAQKSKDENAGKPQQQILISPTRALAYPDYHKVLFLRDPFRRLVSFYAYWVVRVPCFWTYADELRRFWLYTKTFRRFMYIMEHLQQHDLGFQHHLVPQLRGAENIDFDQVIFVEDLSAGLLSLNERLGMDFKPPNKLKTRYLPTPDEEAADRTPNWLRKHGIPQASRFFNQELWEIAEHIYREDLAVYRRHGGDPVRPASH